MRKLPSHGTATTTFKVSNNFGTGRTPRKKEGGDTQRIDKAQRKKGLGRSYPATTARPNDNQSGRKTGTTTSKARITGDVPGGAGKKGHGKGDRPKAPRSPGKVGLGLGPNPNPSPVKENGDEDDDDDDDDDDYNNDDKRKKRYLTEKKSAKRKRRASRARERKADETADPLADIVSRPLKIIAGLEDLHRHG